MAKVIEKQIKKITYEFSDGKKLILKDKELRQYRLVCNLTSDYALPANENSKVYVGRLIKGFTPCPKL